MKKPLALLITALVVTVIIGTTVYVATSVRGTAADPYTVATEQLEADIAMAQMHATSPPSTAATEADVASAPRFTEPKSSATQPTPSTSSTADINDDKRDMAELAVTYQDVINRQIAEHRIDAKLQALQCNNYICSGELVDGDKDEYNRWGKLFTHAARTSMYSMQYGARRMPNGQYVLSFSFNADREGGAVTAR
jgi:hypothetical protein